VKRSRGFTLIEIMVVVAIIGSLLSVALPRLTGHAEEARLQAARLQVENLGMAIDAFSFDCARFPTSEEGVGALRESPGEAGWKGPYLKRAVPLDPWKSAYVYVRPGLRAPDYDVYSAGPDRQTGTEDDIGNW
jgi:general secretion pathway protein G